MAETTGIAYVHHTRNFWTGCTKVGPGCDGCYAEAFQRWIRGKDPETGEAKNWGPGRQRVPHLEGAAKDLRRWNRKAAAAGVRRRVFINTQSDTFDNEAPQEWRGFMWPVLVECTSLDILLVTKRIGNVPDMVPPAWMRDGFPANIRVIITAVDQRELTRDAGKLIELPCKNGLSYEPALGPLPELWRCLPRTPDRQKGTEWDKVGLQWVIVGGESKQAGAIVREFRMSWALKVIEQCKAAGVPCFVKQLGDNFCIDRQPFFRMANAKAQALNDPAEWPEDLRVQQVPA